VLLKIPTYTLTQRLQHCAFLKENFHTEIWCGYNKNTQNTRNHFHVQKQPFWKKLKKNYVTLQNTNKTSFLYMSFATKQNKKLKFKGVRNTATLKLKQDTLLTPLILGVASFFGDQSYLISVWLNNYFTTKHLIFLRKGGKVVPYWKDLGFGG
jgi:hypothetical protein